jgi:hypothetical protein
MPTDELENELRRILARTAADFESLDQVRERLLQRDYHPRLRNQRLAARIGVGAAGVALVIGLGVSGVFGSAGHRPSHPASHLAHARLAAWTVTKEADGRIFLKIRELRDPAALQRKLRADGVPASVVFHPGPPGELVSPWRFLQFKNNPCQEYGGGEGQAQNVVRGGSMLTGMFLYPSAIPNGAGVQIVATRNAGGPPFPLFEWLVQASPQCTGS